MKSKLTRILFGSALLALLACQAMAEGKISGITTKVVGDGLQVQIKGQELTAPKIMRVQGGRSFMLEFDASLSTDPQWLRVEQGGVHYVQSVVYSSNPPKIRIHLRVDPNTRLETASNDEGFIVKAAPATAPNPIQPAVAQTVETPEATPTSVQIFRQPAALTPAPKPQHIPVTAITSHTAGNAKFISLDFVNTELVQILKAVAMQAGVNIVTAPDVKGSLTVSLGGVGVNEALDLITTLANVKYAQVGNTYLVTSARNMTATLSTLRGGARTVAVTKIVPLYSGEGTQIKGALAAQNPDVQFLLPSEKPVAMPVAGSDADASARAAAAAATPSNPQASGGATPNTTGAVSPKDAYLVLVGEGSNVARVTATVEDADEQMCHVLGIEYPRTAAMVNTVYHPRGLAAATLLGAVAMSQSSNSTSQTASGGSGGGSGSGSSGLTHARIGTVDLYATPLNSVSGQAISLSGRETEVNRLIAAMESIDTLNQSYGDFTVYNVKYADPRALREDLLVQFPGLSVNLGPGNPLQYNVYHADIRQQAMERTSTANGAAVAGGGNGQQPANAGTVTLAADDATQQGIELPFKDEENYAVPMKLEIRGPKEMLDSALAYLNTIDVAPKQVAIDLRVMELTKEDALRLGLDWSILTGGSLHSLRLNNGLGDTADTPGTASGTLGFRGGGSLSLLGTLDEIGSHNHLIARPNLLALDGRQSEVFIGDVIRYIESIQATQNGTTVTTGQVPVGVRLAVLPRVGGDNSIAMDLRPVVSQLNGFTPVPGGGELPQTSVRIQQDSMIMHDGETIALGGMIQDQDLKTRSGIPILKDLPLIGMLFSRTNNDHKRTEVVFFLTAHVVDGDRANAANPVAHPDRLGMRGQHK